MLISRKITDDRDQLIKSNNITYKKAGASPAFFMWISKYYEFFSERYRSASMAAIHPVPAAVTACR